MFVSHFDKCNFNISSQLGQIFPPNDGECHLDPSTNEYEKTLDQVCLQAGVCSNNYIIELFMLQKITWPIIIYACVIAGITCNTVFVSLFGVVHTCTHMNQ